MKSKVALAVAAVLLLAAARPVCPPGNTSGTGTGTGGGGGGTQTGICAQSAPSQASAIGLGTLNTCDDFTYSSLSFLDLDTADTSTTGLLPPWSGGLWYEGHPAASLYTIGSSNFQLFAGGPNSDNYVSTEFHDTSGGRFYTPPFYAEARASFTDWGSFWFISVAHSRGQTVGGTPSTYSAEIDVIETDPASNFAHTAFTTLHRNTGGNGGVADTFTNCTGGGTAGIGNGAMPNGGSTQNQFHIYGALVTSTTVTFYVDNVQVCCVNSYDSTQQAYLMILGANFGGVTGSSNVGTAQSTFDWVRVWTQ